MTRPKKTPAKIEGHSFNVTFEKDGQSDNFIVSAPTLEGARKLAMEILEQRGLNVKVNHVKSTRITL